METGVPGELKSKNIQSSSSLGVTNLIQHDFSNNNSASLQNQQGRYYRGRLPFEYQNVAMAIGLADSLEDNRRRNGPSVN